MPKIIYFSSLSGNTKKFVERLDIPNEQIPISPKNLMIRAKEPFILITPTYADNQGRGAVPKQVKKFLNLSNNRDFLKGVIAGGNTNFGEFYGQAGKVISKKCSVPLLYKFELTGNQSDVINVKNGIKKLWLSLGLSQ